MLKGVISDRKWIQNYFKLTSKAERCILSLLQYSGLKMLSCELLTEMRAEGLWWVNVSVEKWSMSKPVMLTNALTSRKWVTWWQWSAWLDVLLLRHIIPLDYSYLAFVLHLLCDSLVKKYIPLSANTSHLKLIRVILLASYCNNKEPWRTGM